jgi:hypothetical protein
VPSALSYPQAVDPTTYLPYQSAQVLIASGTWRHPKPGFPIVIRYRVVGGGGGGGGPTNGAGGGGSGRISALTQATVTTDLTVTIGAGGAVNGGTGGTSTFNALSAAGGSGGGDALDNGGNGGSGGFGGGGGGAVSASYAGGNGGEGLDFIGGGGGQGSTDSGSGGSGGNGGRSAYGLSSSCGMSGTITNGNTPYQKIGGYPNGAGNSRGNAGMCGIGGYPGILFPYMEDFGSGGRGTDAGGGSNNAGKPGAVFIWYNRP